MACISCFGYFRREKERILVSRSWAMVPATSSPLAHRLPKKDERGVSFSSAPMAGWLGAETDICPTKRFTSARRDVGGSDAKPRQRQGGSAHGKVHKGEGISATVQRWQAAAAGFCLPAGAAVDYPRAVQ
ncbi:unnamed protein product [Phaeothamnion confervicola]